MANEGTEEDKQNSIIPQPHAVVSISSQNAEEAYKTVLEKAGASYKRDTLDQRIIQNVKNRTGAIIDVQGGYPHHSPFEITLNAWPTLQSLPAPVDSDGDGMPDSWEQKHQLNPRDPQDARNFTLQKQYTNLEVYIHSIVQ
jgi:hypothetical protein